MFKTMKEEAPNYLMNLIPKCNQTRRTRNSHIPVFHCRADCFKYYFSPSTFNLDDNIRRVLLFISPVQKSVFNIFDLKELKLLTWLRLGFSHVNEHNFDIILKAV